MPPCLADVSGNGKFRSQDIDKSLNGIHRLRRHGFDWLDVDDSHAGCWRMRRRHALVVDGRRGIRFSVLVAATKRNRLLHAIDIHAAVEFVWLHIAAVATEYTRVAFVPSRCRKG